MAFQRRKPAAIGVKAPFPGFIEPALATSIEKVPSRERSFHEIFKKRVAHKGIWVEPKLLAEIEHRAKSAEGKVNHPFSGAYERTCNGRIRSLLAMGEQAVGKFADVPVELHQAVMELAPEERRTAPR